MSAGDIVKLVVSIVVCEGAGGIGAIFTTPAITTWYATLQKPAFTPPNPAFGPVWITLYLLMAIAAFLIWRMGLDTAGVKAALGLFLAQLIVNVVWSVVFFGQHSLLGGVILILVLWVLILVNIIRFFPLSAVAGGLLIPYIVWVSIASYLNIAIWKLNS